MLGVGLSHVSSSLGSRDEGEGRGEGLSQQTDRPSSSGTDLLPEAHHAQQRVAVAQARLLEAQQRCEEARVAARGAIVNLLRRSAGPVQTSNARRTVSNHSADVQSASDAGPSSPRLFGERLVFNHSADESPISRSKQ